jgi:hypothetical protein
VEAANPRKDLAKLESEGSEPRRVPLRYSTVHANKPTKGSDLAPQEGLGLANTTLGGYDAAKNYLDEFLASDASKYPAFDKLDISFVENDHLLIFFRVLGKWFAEKQFLTLQKKWLTTKTKKIYFGKIKEMFKEKFPDHE